MKLSFNRLSCQFGVLLKEITFILRVIEWFVSVALDNNSKNFESKISHLRLILHYKYSQENLLSTSSSGKILKTKIEQDQPWFENLIPSYFAPTPPIMLIRCWNNLYINFLLCWIWWEPESEPGSSPIPKVTNLFKHFYVFSFHFVVLCWIRKQFAYVIILPFLSHNDSLSWCRVCSHIQLKNQPNCFSVI